MTDRDDLRARSRQAKAKRERNRRPIARWIRWLVVGAPVVFILCGIGLIIDAALFVSEAESTRGEVIEIQTKSSGHSISYTPLIRYRDSAGRAHEAETHISSSAYDYDIGERVDVLYGPDDPEVVRIASFFSLYGIGLIFALMGALFLAIAAVARRMMLTTHKGRALQRFERQARGAWRHEAESTGSGAWDSKPVTTDPSVYGHAHKPKPKREPTVRRMR